MERITVLCAEAGGKDLAERIKRMAMEVFWGKEKEVVFHRVRTLDEARDFFATSKPDLFVLVSPFTDDKDVGRECDVLLDLFRGVNELGDLFVITREERPTLYELGLMTRRGLLFSEKVLESEFKSYLRLIM